MRFNNFSVIALITSGLILSACSLDSPEHPADSQAEPVTPPNQQQPVPQNPSAPIATLFKVQPVVSLQPRAIQLADQDDVAGLRELVEKSPRAVWDLDENGRSALHYARSKAAAELLWNVPMPRAYRNLKDPILLHQLPDKDGKTATLVFAEEGRTQSLDYAVDMLCKETSLFQIFLGCKAPINDKDLRGRTALHYAVENGDLQNVKTLLSCKAINANAYDREYNTPLHLASARADQSIVNALLEAGSHVWARNKAGQRARPIPKN